MKRFHTLVVAGILTVLLAACSSHNKIDNDTPAEQLYTAAQQKLQDGAFRSAITDLESLDNRYPFGAYSTQVQLDLIYAYYKAKEYSLAQSTIDRFIRLNPTHPNIDYVLYMRGVTNMEMGRNMIQDIFGIDRYDRDPTNLEIAFRDFTYLIDNYPSSAYSNDAQKRLVSLKDSLSKYELSVVKFYTKRQAYVAVTNRVENMLKYFPDTISTYQALPYMKQAYIQLHLPQQAAKVDKLIQANRHR